MTVYIINVKLVYFITLWALDKLILNLKQKLSEKSSYLLLFGWIILQSNVRRPSQRTHDQHGPHDHFLIDEMYQHAKE